MTLVVLLRGVNVGGHNTFRPKKLADRLKPLQVVNVGAAGSFVVRNAVSQAALRHEVKRALPFEAEVMVCSGRLISDLVKNDPFPDQPSGSDLVRFVSVLARRPVTPVIPFGLPSDTDWLLRVVECRGRFVFGVYRRQLKAIACLGRLEKIFGMPVTTRSWNTITALARLTSAPVDFGG
jgi:uncharacterized protein (DUF1697 family)